MVAPIWETESSHGMQENNDVIHTNCVVIIKIYSLRHATCLNLLNDALCEEMHWEVEMTYPYESPVTS